MDNVTKFTITILSGLLAVAFFSAGYRHFEAPGIPGFLARKSLPSEQQLQTAAPHSRTEEARLPSVTSQSALTDTPPVSSPITPSSTPSPAPSATRPLFPLEAPFRNLPPASDSNSGTAGAKAGAGAFIAETKTELVQKMEELNSAYKKLKKQVRDHTETAETSALLETAKTALTAALPLTPKKALTQPAADLSRFMEEYRSELEKMRQLFDKLEVALSNKNHAEALILITKIDEQQRSSHNQMRASKSPSP